MPPPAACLRFQRLAINSARVEIAGGAGPAALPIISICGSSRPGGRVSGGRGEIRRLSGIGGAARGQPAICVLASSASAPVSSQPATCPIGEELPFFSLWASCVLGSHTVRRSWVKVCSPSCVAQVPHSGCRIIVTSSTIGASSPWVGHAGAGRGTGRSPPWLRGSAGAHADGRSNAVG